MRKHIKKTYLEIIAIILIESLQRLDQQEIGGEPCEERRGEKPRQCLMSLKNNLTE
jgi:hypothetical protein